MPKRHEIRILDLDTACLMAEENLVKTAVRRAKIRARVSMVSDNLAIARQGLMDKVPVVEIDGVVVSCSQDLDMTYLIQLFQMYK